MKNNNTEVFLSLLSAGLWEKDVQISSFGDIDYSEVYRLASEQTVIGLVTAGLEHVIDVNIPQGTALTFVRDIMQIEQRNIAMNSYIENLYSLMQQDDLYSILVKGQGIAQCYERPLWRSPGDIDLLLNRDNYKKAKERFNTIGQVIEKENTFKKHVLFRVNSWDVELHGTMRGELSSRIDKVIDEVHYDIFYNGNVRLWKNGKTSIFLPSPENDTIIVFTHILQHFFKGGIGLRQICDWCRLLWTYRNSLDLRQLERYLNKMGVMTEWKSFASLVVKVLGMPENAIPFYSSSKKWENKSFCIMSYILDVGNFGHNRDMSYIKNTPIIIRKLISLWHYSIDSIRQMRIFPRDSFLVWNRLIWNGFQRIMKGR